MGEDLGTVRVAENLSIFEDPIVRKELLEEAKGGVFVFRHGISRGYRKESEQEE